MSKPEGQTKSYLIVSTGCDAQTEIEVELTPSEFATVDRIAQALTAAAPFSCMPDMRISEIKKEVPA